MSDSAEHARLQVTLATGLAAEDCRAVNLGYRDPRSIDPSAWAAGAGLELLVISRAGETLYRVKPS